MFYYADGVNYEYYLLLRFRFEILSRKTIFKPIQCKRRQRREADCGH
jgi:hypothetical protein